MLKTRAPWLPRLLKGVGLGFVLVVVGPYVWGPIYRFPEPTRFGGSQFWNPYARLTGTWQRTNLHAHGRAWVGLTNGQQSDQEVVQRYRDLGYNVPGVSDYQRIAAQHGIATMPIYEHGYNINKRHQLAIGAHSVQWFDFPLWQSLSHEQYVIDKVKAKADLVALAHPATRDAYTTDDLRQLTTYDLIEVVNGPFAVEDAWDAALSTGHAVWAVANDDTHDLTDSRRTAAAWNMIDSSTTSTSDVVNALRTGRSYAVLRTGTLESANLTMLNGVDVSENTLTVSIAGAESTFSFVGQDGTIRKTVKNAVSASYTIGGCGYVRAHRDHLAADGPVRESHRPVRREESSEAGCHRRPCEHVGVARWQHAGRRRHLAGLRAPATTGAATGQETGARRRQASHRMTGHRSACMRASGAVLEHRRHSTELAELAESSSAVSPLIVVICNVFSERQRWFARFPPGLEFLERAAEAHRLLQLP